MATGGKPVAFIGIKGRQIRIIYASSGEDP